MANSTENRVDGTFHEVKGAVKEKAGEVFNDPKLAAEGTDEKTGGTIERKVGEVKKVFGN